MKRAAAYCRVSTGRQAEADLSLPDQQRQIEAYCRRQGWDLVRVYIEPGASARDDDRPEFRRMVAEATSAEPPFDVLVVHSLSRFFRDEALGELYVRRLRRHKVELQSVTQQLSADPLSDLARRVVGLLDEHTSKETAKHTLRSMQENARQGYWNGSVPPLGYKVVSAGQKGARTKKRLAIDEAEAELVRRIFHLYAEGENGSGPMGTKRVTSFLNEAGIRTRAGAPFSIKGVHEILTRETYVGRHYFGVSDSRTGETKPRDQWIEVQVDPIVDLALFEAVQARLRERNPKKTPARTSGSPYLLTGVLRCGHCGGAMTMASGKSGRYRYYRCCSRARSGPTVCRGQTTPMAKLDRTVLALYRDQVLDPTTLKNLVEGVRARIEASTGHAQALATTAAELAAAEAAVDRLFQLVATGVLAADAPDLKRHLAEAASARDRARARHAEAERIATAPLAAPSRDQYRALAATLRRRLEPPTIPARKQALRAIVDRIEMTGDGLKFVGSARKLAFLAANADENRVIGFMAGWRPHGDSNPCYSDAMGCSLSKPQWKGDRRMASAAVPLEDAGPGAR